jgi:hypothetical protein
MLHHGLLWLRLSDSRLFDGWRRGCLRFWNGLSDFGDHDFVRVAVCCLFFLAIGDSSLLFRSTARDRVPSADIRAYHREVTKRLTGSVTSPSMTVIASIFGSSLIELRGFAG